MQTGSVISNSSFLCAHLPLLCSSAILLILLPIPSVIVALPSLFSSLVMLREVWLPQWRSLSLHSIPPNLPCSLIDPLLVSLAGQIHAVSQTFWFLLTEVFHWITCVWPSYLVYIYFISSPSWSSLLHCSSCLLLPLGSFRSNHSLHNFSIPFFFDFNLL